MEKYLKEEYDVYEDEQYLIKEEEIVDTFKDIGSEFLDCGQGYYQDRAEIICKIGEKYYKVKIIAEIMSAKQDVGDRLYWIYYIKSVKYEEIEKPQPKKRLDIIYSLNITEYQKEILERFMSENHIKYQ